MIRALGAMLLVVLVLIAGAAAALWWFPAPLLRAALRAGGLQAVSFTDLRLGRGSLEVDGLQIGTPPDHRLARLQIGYRLGDLVHGRLASLELEGLELHGRLVDGRIELAGRAAPQEAGAEFSLPGLPWPARIILRAAEIQIATPWGELRAPLAAELRPAGPAAAFTLEMTGGQLINDAGRLRADLTLAGNAPFDRVPTLQDLAAQGRLTLAAESFALPDLAGGIDGGAEIAFELAAGHLEARVAAGELRVAELAPVLAPLQAPLPPPWRIDLDEPLRVGGQLDGAELALDLDGALQLAAGAAKVGLDLAAHLAGDASGRLSAIGGRASLTPSALRWPAAALEHGRLELAGEGSPQAWQGTLELELAGSAQPAPAIALEGATLRHHLGLRLTGRELQVTAREAGTLAIERLAWQAKGQAGPLAFTLPPQDAPLLSASFAAAGGVSWQQQLRATGAAFELALGAGSTALRGRAEPGELTLALAGDQDGLRTGRVALAGGGLRLPAQQLALEGIASEAVLAPEGLAPGQTIPLTVKAISHGAAPAWFAPLSLRATLRPGAEALDFDALLDRPATAFALTLHGRHSLTSARGSAKVELAPLTFAPGKLQPRALAPLSGDLLTDVAGTLALGGTLAWGAGDQVSADLALLLDNLAFSAGPARFSQVNGVVEIDRLWPLGTPPGQQLAIGLVDLGLPLTRGLLAFQLLPERTLAVERLRWDFAGGTVRAAPFRVGSAASDIILTLSAEKLDLAQLFALTRLEGLSGEGSIRGTLPVRISGAEAVIEGGELSATGPGWLRYRSDGVPAALQAGGENVTLLLQALENFRYEALRITLDGRTDAEMDIGLHVKGANPKLYGGYPIEFNLNLEGELANLLRSGLASYQIPDSIRKRMQGFHR